MILEMGWVSYHAVGSIAHVYCGRHGYLYGQVLARLQLMGVGGGPGGVLQGTDPGAVQAWGGTPSQACLAPGLYCLEETLQTCPWVHQGRQGPCWSLCLCKWDSQGWSPVFHASQLESHSSLEQLGGHDN